METHNLPKNSKMSDVEIINWTLLSDLQKTQALLGSSRLLDAELYLKQFTSYNEPKTVRQLELNTV